MAKDHIVWGVLGVAKINDKVVPPMASAAACRVKAIASRSKDRAEAAAAKYGLPVAHGSYEALLADPEIDAVYIPLPNHLHVEWSINAMEAGKHVLCEKPLGLTRADAARLVAVAERTGRRVQEAFMVRTHPQWHRAREIVASGAIGELRAIQGFFSYHLLDPNNIRNKADIGGGGMLDIGCYPITTSRFVTGLEPKRVIALIDRDPAMGVDRLGSVILDYEGVQASFAYSTQLVPYQRMHFFGTKGRVEVEIPFNAPVDRPCRLLVDDGTSLVGHGIRVEEVATCDQYGIAGTAFSRALLDGGPQPVPLTDSLKNMAVIDACFRSDDVGGWVTL